MKREEVLALLQLRPVERLRGIVERHPHVKARVDALLDGYDAFLLHVARGKEPLAAELRNDETFRSARSAEARQFGDNMFELLLELATEPRGRDLLRHMVV